MAGRTKTLPGYMAPGPSGHYTMVWNQPGQATYIAATGQVIQAAPLGIKGFDYVDSEAISESGTYFCRVKYGATIAAGANAAQHKTSVAYITLFWYVVATGAAMTNADLSGETIRLKAVVV